VTPNVLLVVMDTARADFVDGAGDTEKGPSDSGDGRATMPTLDALAERGTRFTNATANAPWTLPSHATLFTGVPPSVHGAHAGHRQFDYGPTLAERLAAAGYRTVAISNNTWVSEEFGFDRGFETFLSTWQLFQDAVDFGDVAQTRTGLAARLRGVAAKFRGNPVKNFANLVYGRFGRKRRDDGARRTNRLVEERIDEWAGDDRPLFLFCNYLEPHLEYRPPEAVAREWLPDDISYADASAVNQDAWACVTGQTEMDGDDFRALRALYRAELSYLDRRVDDLLDSFEAAGLLQDTVVVVTGDHGEHVGEYGLMDHQYALTPELLSVPLVVAGPGFESGRVATPVQLADLVPTIAEVAGLTDEAPAAGDVSPAGDAFGAGRPRSLCHPDSLPEDRPLFAEYVAPQPPVETLRERYAVSRDLSVYDRRLWSVRRGDRLYVRGSDGRNHLFAFEDLSGPATDDGPRTDRDADDDRTGEDRTGDHGTGNGWGCPDRSEAEPDRAAALAESLASWRDTLPAPTERDVDVESATRDRLEDLGYL